MTYTLDTLPKYGWLRIYATGDRTTNESAEHGDIAEGGWVNGIGAKNIYESRNDVAPVFEARIVDGFLSMEPIRIRVDSGTDREARAEIEQLLESMIPYHTNGGSTFYMDEAQVLDYESGDSYTYAIHAHVKTYDSKQGYVETDVMIDSQIGD